MAVGAEATRFNDVDLKAYFVDAYQVKRLGGVVKLTLSPDTNPRVYLLAQYGRSSHRLNYVRSAETASWPDHHTTHTPYWMVGLGLEMDVWKAIFVGVEGDIVKYTSTTLDRLRYYQTNNKKGTALRLRMGVRF